MINPELITQLRAAADAMEKELCTSYEGTLTLDLLTKLKWKISIDEYARLALCSVSPFDDEKDSELFRAFSASSSLCGELSRLIHPVLRNIQGISHPTFTVTRDLDWKGPRIWFMLDAGSHLQLKEAMESLGLTPEHIINRSETVRNLYKERDDRRRKAQQETEDWHVVIDMIEQWHLNNLGD